MSGGSWKVAYADFVTAMMAFFLLMWILNMAPPESKQVIAGYFTADAAFDSSMTSPMANNPMVQQVTKLDTRESQLSEVEKSHYAIAQELRQFLLADALPSASSGISSTRVGVLLHVTNDALFADNAFDLSPQGKQVLDEVIKVMGKYKVFLIVRGHAAKGETGAPYFPSAWELSSARATACVRYLMEHGDITPSYIRAVAYADTQPLVPDTDADAAARNRRVEFYFHRPEVSSAMVSY
jgi:chemotaxis protein MotB